MLPGPGVPINPGPQFIATPPVMAHANEIVNCNVVSTSDSGRIVSIYLRVQDAVTGSFEADLKTGDGLDAGKPMMRLGYTMDANPGPRLVYCEFETNGSTTELRGSIQLLKATGVTTLPAS